MNPFTQQHDADTTESERSGRLILIFIWFTAVTIAGGFGFVIGLIGPKPFRHIQVFGTTLFHSTPFSLALYGMSAVGLILTILYIAVEIASRFDEQVPDS
jgi:uncharacterized membrane protein